MNKDMLIFTLGQASGHFLSIYKKWKRVYSHVPDQETSCLEGEFLEDLEALNEDWENICNILEIDHDHND